MKVPKYLNEKVIIQRLATKYNLPLHVVEEAVYSQFAFVASTIRKGQFESIRLPYLGKFHVRGGRLNYLNNERTDKH
jgi:nucleoid DNA-binding protein